MAMKDFSEQFLQYTGIPIGNLEISWRRKPSL